MLQHPVVAHLEQWWGKHFKCPCCDHDHWSVSDMPVALPHVHFHLPRLLTKRRKARGHAFHAIRCEICGLTLLVSVDLTGLAVGDWSHPAPTPGPAGLPENRAANRTRPPLPGGDAGDEPGPLAGTV